jgi:hypothetical protein
MSRFSNQPADSQRLIRKSASRAAKDLKKQAECESTFTFGQSETYINENKTLKKRKVRPEGALLQMM